MQIQFWCYENAEELFFEIFISIKSRDAFRSYNEYNSFYNKDFESNIVPLTLLYQVVDMAEVSRMLFEQNLIKHSILLVSNYNFTLKMKMQNSVKR